MTKQDPPVFYRSKIIFVYFTKLCMRLINRPKLKLYLPLLSQTVTLNKAKYLLEPPYKTTRRKKMERDAGDYVSLLYCS